MWAGEKLHLSIKKKFRYKPATVRPQVTATHSTTPQSERSKKLLTLCLVKHGRRKPGVQRFDTRVAQQVFPSQPICQKWLDPKEG